MFGTFLCIRFDASKLEEAEGFLQGSDLSSHGGRVEALTDKVNRQKP